jgi:hypothetical protein
LDFILKVLVFSSISLSSMFVAYLLMLTIAEAKKFIPPQKMFPVDPNYDPMTEPEVYENDYLDEAHHLDIDLILPDFPQKMILPKAFHLQHPKIEVTGYVVILAVSAFFVYGWLVNSKLSDERLVMSIAPLIIGLLSIPFVYEVVKRKSLIADRVGFFQSLNNYCHLNKISQREAVSILGVILKAYVSLNITVEQWRGTLSRFSEQLDDGVKNAESELMSKREKYQHLDISKDLSEKQLDELRLYESFLDRRRIDCSNQLMLTLFGSKTDMLLRRCRSMEVSYFIDKGEENVSYEENLADIKVYLEDLNIVWTAYQDIEQDIFERVVGFEGTLGSSALGFLSNGKKKKDAIDPRESYIDKYKIGSSNTSGLIKRVK